MIFFPFCAIIVHDKLYFLIGLRNKSNITYNIQSYLFSIVNKQSKKNVSEQVINIDPIETKNKIDILGVNQEENLVFVFDKFTIDDKKMFKIEIFEDYTKIVVPTTSMFTQSMLVVPALQLLSYYVALKRGCDIDKPRNLAKSVTVE